MLLFIINGESLTEKLSQTKQPTKQTITVTTTYSKKKKSQAFDLSLEAKQKFQSLELKEFYEARKTTKVCH